METKENIFVESRNNSTAPQSKITLAAIREEAKQLLVEQSKVKSNTDVLNILLDDVQSINFQEIIYSEIVELKERLSTETDDEERGKIISDIKKYKVTDRQKYVVIIEELLRLANERQWGICSRVRKIVTY